LNPHKNIIVKKHCIVVKQAVKCSADGHTSRCHYCHVIIY